jgi:hypothetical protein
MSVAKAAVCAAIVCATLLQTTMVALSDVNCLRVVNVDFWDVLYVRAAETHRAKAVGAIAPDHTGIIQLKGPCMPAGQSPKRQWCPVNYFPLPSVRISGFVKAYFVTPKACPAGFVGAP